MALTTLLPSHTRIDIDYDSRTIPTGKNALVLTLGWPFMK